MGRQAKGRTWLAPHETDTDTDRDTDTDTNTDTEREREREREGEENTAAIGATSPRNRDGTSRRSFRSVARRSRRWSKRRRRPAASLRHLGRHPRRGPACSRSRDAPPLSINRRDECSSASAFSRQPNANLGQSICPCAHLGAQAVNRPACRKGEAFALGSLIALMSANRGRPAAEVRGA